MISFLLNVLSLVLWHSTWSDLENVPCTLEEPVDSAVAGCPVKFSLCLSVEACGMFTSLSVCFSCELTELIFLILCELFIY